MSMKIFNQEILDTYIGEVTLDYEVVEEALATIFEEMDFDANIIFVTPDEIQQLNIDFRKRDEPTDVVSFPVSDSLEVGEVYISPCFIEETMEEATPKAILKEVLRMMVHGLLHVSGSVHEGYFDEKSEDEPEEMFEEQEDLLEKLISELTLEL